MFQLIKDEKVIETKRRYIAVFYLQVVPIIIIIILLLFFAFLNFFIPLGFLQEFLADFFNKEMEMFSVHFLASFFSVTLAGFLWLVVLLDFIFYYFDVWILTNKRIISTSIISLFSKKVYTISLKNIENIRTSRKGFLANIYNFGDLEIETAGNYENFALKCIANETEFKKIIFTAMEQKS